MAEKPIFKKIAQVALVVKNVEERAKRYWDEFGIGPWSFYTFDPSCVENMMIHGKRVDHAMRIALAMIGDIMWELIEPLDDKSIYAEHLEKHGEGLHHVLFEVDDFDEAKTRIQQRGYGVLQSGKWHSIPYTYFDTEKPLACITEIYTPPPEGESFPAPEATYP